MKYPNFLIIGAARSGTTTLYECLRLHSDIYFPLSDAEPKFFSREQEYIKGNEYYLDRYFFNADAYVAVGEKSTEYMENQSSAIRIYSFNPSIKLLCMLRDPVERAISNYWWSVSNGHEKRPINEALRAEWKNYLNNPGKITSLNSARPFAYIDRSLYYENLLPFYMLFTGTSIKCIIFEEFLKSRIKICEDIFLFLQVKLMDLPVDSVGAQRFVPRGESLDGSLYRELRDFFYEKNSGLSELIGIDVSRYWHRKI